MATTRTKTTVTEQEKDDELITLGAWLAGLNQGAETIRRVQVYKKSGSGTFFHYPRYGLDPPFDQDVNVIFQALGDGDYKFVPENDHGKLRGMRLEHISGFGAGDAAPASSGASAAPRRAVDLGELAEQIRAELDYEMLTGRLEDLRERREQREDRRRAREMGAIPEGAPPMTPEDREALHTESFKRQLETFAQLMALTQGGSRKQEELLSQVMGAVIGKLVDKPEPADRLLDMVGKVLELRDKLAPAGGLGEDVDWKTLLVASVVPALRDMVPALTRRPGAIPAATEPAPIEPAPAAKAPAASAAELSSPIDRARNAIARVWPVVKSAALAGSTAFDLYADLIDEQMPGFLDMWTRLTPEDAIRYLTELDAEVSASEPLNRWLLQFHHALTTREPEEDTHHDNRA